jgi:hypothetical protein
MHYNRRASRVPSVPRGWRLRLMTKKKPSIVKSYDGLLQGVVHLLEETRRGAARSVNAIMTATYWEIGRRIVEHEQEGKQRAE